LYFKPITAETYNPAGSPPVADNNPRSTISNGGNINIVNHNGSTTGLQLNGTLITATATELNVLDGYTEIVCTIVYRLFLSPPFTDYFCPAPFAFSVHYCTDYFCPAPFTLDSVIHGT
jgi:hypothetical protein